MSPLRGERGNVIPAKIHFLRVRQWPSIVMRERILGGTIQRFKAIDRIIGVAKRLENKIEIPEKKQIARLKGQAKAITLQLAMVTDQYFEARKLIGINEHTETEWNEVYEEYLKRVSNGMPEKLFNEIIRQIREE